MPAVSIWLIGDPKKAYDAAPVKIDAEFITPLASHVPIEPMNAVAFFDKGTLHLFSGSQLQAAHQPMLAACYGHEAATGGHPPDVFGGGFGRRLDDDDVDDPAALPPRRSGGRLSSSTPATKSSGMTSIGPSPISVSARALTRRAMSSRCVMMSAWHRRPYARRRRCSRPARIRETVQGRRQLDRAAATLGTEFQTTRRVASPMISVNGRRRRASCARCRRLGPIFALESFLDELARKTGKDPVQMRLSLLTATGLNAGSVPMSVGGAERIAAVIRKAAKETDFEKKHGRLGPGRGIGLAATTHFRDTPTWTCGIAEVAVDKESGQIKSRSSRRYGSWLASQYRRREVTMRRRHAVRV